MDAHRREDLLQEIHLALWTSFANFGGECLLRTWVYRVAHNVATSHVIRDRRQRSRALVGLDEVESLGDGTDSDHAFDRKLLVDRMLALIQRLKPIDRQLMLLYLEGEDAASIAEVTGLSAGNVSTKVHRIKKILREQMGEGGNHGG